MPTKVVRTFETYQPATIQHNNISEPSTFNGYVLIRRFKVTVEEIIEPDDVLIARLKELFRRTTNWHNKSAVLGVAQNDFGLTMKDFK